MTLKGTNHLHLYAQTRHHADAFIVGNREGLTRLRDALNKSLEDGQAQAEFFPSDGEGYDTYIKLLNDDDEELFESLEMPYSEQFGPTNRNNLYEHQTDDKNAPYNPKGLFI
ncbi:hypothetical protein ACIQLG_00720 [Terribacillus saccharophilus]|uniref:hypothetical protein n=1 Tax=Terribacillus saccharophilus TaxID=361277 RepID=UPI003810A465